MNRSTSALATLVALTTATACHRAVAPLVSPGKSAVALTGGPGTSMIYLARTTDGILAIDLGWWDNRRALQHALKTLNADTSDVRWVFLTHSHRDHIAAWPMLRRAVFFVGAAEQPRLFGDSAHRGWVPQLAERVKPSGLPEHDSLKVTAFSGDTMFVFGTDTVRAYAMAGHTPGSVVYLFRGVLFLGDAVTWSHRHGFAPAQPRMSDDPRAAAANLKLLWKRLPENSVHYACTAHARCASFNKEFVSDIDEG